jgi:sugar phosphate isomerase/epimerase
MQFGVCADPEDAAWIPSAGADFIEGHVQKFLKPAEETWEPAVGPDALPLPLAAYNCFLPGDLKVTGPNVDTKRLAAYAARAFARARRMGSSLIVFGSGAARMVPGGWPHEKAADQLAKAMRIVGPLAHAEGITVAMEPLNRGETNILNSVADGLHYVRRAKAEGLTVLCDFYHLAVEEEPLGNLDAAKGLLSHVHIAEPVGRVAPGPNMTDYRPFFAKLKAIGYDARISLECTWDDMRSQLAPTLEFLRREWEAA